MSLTLSIDIDDATFADLTAVITAAQAAGINPESKLSLNGSVLQVTVDHPGNAPHGMRDDDRRDALNGRGEEASRGTRSHVGPVGEAAVRSVIDILTGNQEPPRHSARRFGRFDTWENDD